MTYRFEKVKSVRAAALKYWDTYYVWEQCKAEPQTTMLDWADCARECRKFEDAWATEIWKAGGKGRNGAWSLSKCRAWVKGRILEVIDADNAVRRSEMGGAR